VSRVAKYVESRVVVATDIISVGPISVNALQIARCLGQLTVDSRSFLRSCGFQIESTPEFRSGLPIKLNIRSGLSMVARRLQRLVAAGG
jgi:hypothetical protein